MLVYPHQHDLTVEYDYPRSYLDKLVGQKTLVITDNKLGKSDTWLTNLINTADIDSIIIDTTHNPLYSYYDLDRVVANAKGLKPTTVLTNNFKTDRYNFLPIFLWLYSNKNSAWHNNIVFDTANNKTRKMCCLNRNPSWHRIYLYLALHDANLIEHIDYTFGTHNPTQMDYQISVLSQEEQLRFAMYKSSLPITVDNSDLTSTNDVGISHPVYQHCAFNLVTETTTEDAFVSEKTCKPFIANQIPIIVGPVGISQFLSNLGLDMFDDVVGWSQWDQVDDTRSRIDIQVRQVQKLLKKDLVRIYKNLQTRVDRNKKYFHSQEFRSELHKRSSLAV